nr:unnamed protein product [Callosobruchus chinensis]
MLKLVVLLFAMVAVAFARPGFLHGYHAHPIVIPAAVSHTYRADIIHKPIVTVPVIHKVVAAPIIAHPPLLAYPSHHGWW